MVRDMNRQAGKPFVEKQLGGKSGGGAVVTSAGQEAIRSFRSIEKNISEHINKSFKKVRF